MDEQDVCKNIDYSTLDDSNTVVDDVIHLRGEAISGILSFAFSMLVFSCL